MNIVSHEEAKFREIEQRHMFNSKAMIPQPTANPIDSRTSEAVSTYNSMYDRDNRGGNTTTGFDDVTSIKTEQYKLSAREHCLLENHLFSHS